MNKLLSCNSDIGLEWTLDHSNIGRFLVINTYLQDIKDGMGNEYNINLSCSVNENNLPDLPGPKIIT